MNEEYKQLIKKFNGISNLKWIKGINNKTNSVGLTFESLINKKFDSMFFSDFKGIEIKCTQRYSRYPISLFTCSFDGPNLYQMNIILQKYGKCDYIFKDKKILNETLSCKKEILVNNKWYFKIEIARNSQKLFLCISDINHTLLDKPYIDFSTIESHLITKLSTMFLVFASKKTSIIIYILDTTKQYYLN